MLLKKKVCGIKYKIAKVKKKKSNKVFQYECFMKSPNTSAC